MAALAAARHRMRVALIEAGAHVGGIRSHFPNFHREFMHSGLLLPLLSPRLIARACDEADCILNPGDDGKDCQSGKGCPNGVPDLLRHSRKSIALKVSLFL